MPDLRDYQIRLIENLRREARNRPIAVLPCGAGKTVCASEIIRRATARGLKTLFVAHRIELVMQAFRRIVDHSEREIIPGIIAPDQEPQPSLPVQVASIQTLHRRKLYPPADLVIIDECSHVRASSWSEVLDNYKNSMLIGLTATPFRLDGKGLGSIFGSIVVGATYEQLCSRGYLHKPEVYAPSIPDLSGLRTRMGEYSAAELEPRVKMLVGDIVTHWLRLCPGKRTVAFAVSIEHSHAIVEQFLAAGVRSEHIDGTTPKLDRAAAIARLESGETKVLSNCEILGEGVDIPALEVAILARPTASLALHIQQVGRVMRLCDGKDGALILDHAGNHLTHGEVTDELEFSLTDKVKKKSPRSLSRCPKCFLVLEPPGDECPECGWTREEPKPRELPQHDEDATLVKLASGDARREVYRQLVATASTLGRRLGWAKHDYKAKFGVWPRFPQIDDLYTCVAHTPETKQYGYKTVQRCAYCLRELDAAGRAVQRVVRV